MEMNVKNFPAFILVDDKGHSFFDQIQMKACAGCQK